LFHILSPVIILIPFRGTQFKKKAEQSDGPKTEKSKMRGGNQHEINRDR